MNHKFLITLLSSSNPKLLKLSIGSQKDVNLAVNSANKAHLKWSNLAPY